MTVASSVRCALTSEKCDYRERRAETEDHMLMRSSSRIASGSACSCLRVRRSMGRAASPAVWRSASRRQVGAFDVQLGNMSVDCK
jgi:hypothetical protein